MNIKKNIIILGAGIAGLETGRSLLKMGIKDFIILEKQPTIIKTNSWKTFPNVIKEFQLEECIATEVDKIYFRAVDISNQIILSNNAPNIKCYVMDSNKVYNFYQKILSTFIETNIEIIDIVYNNSNYIIKTKRNEYICTYLVDGTGAKPILDEYFKEDWFKQKAFYLCYAKRYSNCDNLPIQKSAYFDFDDPLKFCGCWCYPFSNNEAEIGVARFTNQYGISINLKKELDLQIEEYKKVFPFNKVFNNSIQIGDAISGFCALLPRLKIENKNRFFIGDAKGSVTYSGYGTQNALVSGRKCAEAIYYNKKYDYFVTSPSYGLAILKLLWHLDSKRLRKQAEGISMLSEDNIQKFFQGNIDLQFFLKANDISKKLGNNLINQLPIDMILRILLNKKPRKKDYKDWI